MTWNRRTFGRTGLEVSPIGLGASYGLGEREVETAFDRGINYFYWGARRRAGFGRGISNIARRNRDDMVVVVQSYARLAKAIRPSVESALRRLRIGYADVLLLGWWNQPPPDRILEGALALVESGKVRHIVVSCHHRPSFSQFISDPIYGAIMVRYNAAHPGAETEVFPLVDSARHRPGVCAYTATRWGALLDPRLIPDGEPVPRASDCYRFALAAPQVDVCLSGPKDAAELDEALAAITRGPMDADELAWMRRVGAAVHRASAGSALVANPSHMFDRVASRLYRPRGR